MASEWYWSRGQQRFGPVSSAEMVANLRNGTVIGTDLVWTDSMTEWKPAASVPSVAKYLPGAAAASAPMVGAAPVSPVYPTAAPAPAPAAYPGTSVGYYNPAQGLPPRAAETLRGFAPPTGDVSEWPLDDGKVAQFREAYKLRQAVLSSANLFKLMFALSLIGAVVQVLVGLFSFAGGSRRQQAEAVPLIVSAMLGVGFCILYYFAWKATVRCRRWAPITMTVLLSISVSAAVGLMLFGAAVSATSSRRDTSPVFISVVVIAAIGGVFIFVSAKAITAIPKLLATPAWCQELLASKTT